MRPPDMLDSAPTCCATFAAMRREQRAIRQNRDRRRRAQVDPEERLRHLEPELRDRLRAREAVLRPHELEVLGERRRLTGVRQQLRERILVLARVERTAHQLLRASAVHDLRGLGLRIEVLEQELGRLAEARVGQLVVGRREARPPGAASPATAKPAPAAERMKRRRSMLVGAPCSIWRRLVEIY